MGTRVCTYERRLDVDIGYFLNTLHTFTEEVFWLDSELTSVSSIEAKLAFSRSLLFLQLLSVGIAAWSPLPTQHFCEC